MKKTNVVNLAVWKQQHGIAYKPTFYKTKAKIYKFPTNLVKQKVPAKKAA